MDNDRNWLAPLTGVLFVVVLIVAFIIGDEPPDLDEPIEEIVDFYVDNDSSVMFGSVLQTFGAALFVFFAGYLRKVFRDAEGPGGAVSLILFGGATIFATGIALDATINFALAEEADNIDPTAVQALVTLWHNDFLPFALGLFVFLMATGISIVRTGVFPKWMGWVTIALSVLMFTPAFFVALIGGAILVVAMSVMLALRARGAGTPATTT